MSVSIKLYLTYSSQGVGENVIILIIKTGNYLKKLNVFQLF